MALTARRGRAGEPEFLAIDGYTDPMSVQPGEEIALHISTNSKEYSLEIAREGAEREAVWTKAGLPGAAFAKVLRDVETGELPVVSYWKQALIVSDTRIPAMGSDTSAYAFATPDTGGAVTVTAELRFRRAFQTVMDAKGWDTPDIVMEEAQATLSVQPWWGVFLPLVMQDV